MVDFPAHVSSPEGKDDDSSKNMQKLSLSGGRCCVFLAFESWMFNSSLPRAEEHPPGERTAWTVFHELEYSPQFWTNPNVIYDFISFHILLHVHVSMYHTYACAHSMACSMISVIQVSKKIGEHHENPWNVVKFIISFSIKLWKKWFTLGIWMHFVSFFWHFQTQLNVQSLGLTWYPINNIK